MSFRLTPNAHKKNSDVMSTNGTRNLRSVIGAGVAAGVGEDVDILCGLLGDCAIQMSVTAVNEQVLSRSVGRSWTQQKDRGPCDLLGKGHAFAEGNFGCDAGQFFVR